MVLAEIGQTLKGFHLLACSRPLPHFPCGALGYWDPFILLFEHEVVMTKLKFLENSNKLKI